MNKSQSREIQRDSIQMCANNCVICLKHLLPNQVKAAALLQRDGSILCRLINSRGFSELYIVPQCLATEQYLIENRDSVTGSEQKLEVGATNNFKKKRRHISAYAKPPTQQWYRIA